MQKSKIENIDEVQLTSKAIGEDKVCPICGKSFLPFPAWAYKRRAKYMCSYGCTLAWDRANISARERQRMRMDARNMEIFRLRREGTSIEDLSGQFGLTVKTIQTIISRCNTK